MSLVQLTTESTEPEIQFNNGIKMMVSAYETQTSLLSNEISMLNSELEKKNAKIAELEELCSSLLKEKSEYESKLSSLSSTNAKLNHQLDLLMNENKELKKVKEKILSTLEKKQTQTQPKTIERELSQPILLHKSKSKSNLHNGNDLEDFSTYNTPSSTARKTKLVKQGRSAICSSVKYPKRDYGSINQSIINRALQNKQSSQSARNSFSGNISLCNTYGYNGNSSGCGGSGNVDFFKRCRSVMKTDEYSDMIEIVHLFNSKQISKEETYKKISDILSNGKYMDLINEFDRLFS